MNGFAKTCLIMALLFFLLGVGLIAVCAATGSFYETVRMMDGGMLSIGPEDFMLPESGMAGIGEIKSIAASPAVANLDIEAGAARMKIEKSSDGAFHFAGGARVLGNIKCYQNGDTLVVSQEGWHGRLFEKYFRRRSGDVDVVLYVPEGHMFQNANIRFGAGGISLYGLHVENEMNIELGAGHVNGQNVAAGLLTVKVGAGEADFAESLAEEADFDVGMGRIAYDGTIAGNMSADCSMGEINLMLAGSMEEHNYDLDCAMGNIAIGGRNYSGFGSSAYLDNGAASDFSIGCAMGSIAVSFKE